METAMHYYMEVFSNRMIGTMLCATLETHPEDIGNECFRWNYTALFYKTFQGVNVGIEAMYTSSLNLNAKAKFQNAAVKMLALFPTYDKNAASKRLTKEDIKQRELEVHQGCRRVLVRELNQFSRVVGGSRCSLS